VKKILRADAVGVLGLALLLWALAPDAPVADSAMRGDVEAVRALIKQGADVNAAQGDGMTALHWAAMNGSADIARLVIDAGASLEAVTRLGGYTPLHLASRAGRATTVQLLIAAGANVRATTTTGAVTPLHLAADAGNGQSVTALLDAGADPNAREREWGQTPLMFAAAANRPNVVKLLVERGAKVDATASTIDMVERGKEDAALQARRDKLLQALQASGQISREALARVGFRNGVTPPAPTGPSTAPVTAGPSGITSLEALVGRYGGLTPLLLAARDGNLESALALLDGGAGVNQPSAGDRTTPLLMATINGHFDLAMELLERGADPKLASDAGATPLYTTLNTEWIPKSRHPQPADYMNQRTTHLELMKALLEAGADPNARLNYKLWYTEYSREFLGIDWIGATPFLRAAHALDVDAMRLLLEHGADPDLPTLKPAGGRRGGQSADDPSGLPPVPAGGPGVFPIHAATGVGYIHDSAGNTHRHVEDGWMPAVKFLIEEVGVDANIRDFEGFTALHNAAARGDNEMILYLLSKGADPHVVARSGQTTVDAANGPHQRLVPFVETVKLLEGLGVKNNHRCVSC
jgi:ankyrin repeat protein